MHKRITLLDFISQDRAMFQMENDFDDFWLVGFGNDIHLLIKDAHRFFGNDISYTLITDHMISYLWLENIETQL